MKALVSGSTGFIGSAVVESLTSAGIVVWRLKRGEPGTSPGVVQFDPSKDAADPKTFEGFSAVVHLAGENVFGRWTAAKRRRIYDSRVRGTELLCRTLAKVDAKPKVLLCASAIGYYGDRGDEPVDETSEAGSGFLADVCREWEKAAEAASELGIRVVRLRFGIVLAAKGGALGAMMPAFRMGLGGPLGSGRQFMSWITLNDAARAIQFALMNETCVGPINIVGPNPSRNADFSQTLGQVLKRPVWLRNPRFILRAALGRAADELLLSSVRAVPKALTDRGFLFEDSDLEPALRRVLGKEKR